MVWWRSLLASFNLARAFIRFLLKVWIPDPEETASKRRGGTRQVGHLLGKLGTRGWEKNQVQGAGENNSNNNNDEDDDDDDDEKKERPGQRF